MATTSAPDPAGADRGRPGAGTAAARTEELFARFGQTVLGVCLALLRNRAEAEDAAQQTFLSAHRALLNGGEPRDPAAWLAAIARNECAARARARMREPLPVDGVAAVATDGDPAAEAIRRADVAALWQAIDALPRQQRDALVLRELGGLSYGELAAALAVSGPAVESLLFRARSRLRAQLRTAAASLSGASWLDGLARLLAGAGTPAAAKVAVLGAGAAAVTSGALVAPRVLEPHRAPAPHPHTQTLRPHPAPRPGPVERRPAAALEAPAVVPRSSAGPSAPVEQRRRGDRDGTTEAVDHEDRPGHESDGPGPARAPLPEAVEPTEAEHGDDAAERAVTTTPTPATTGEAETSGEDGGDHGDGEADVDGHDGGGNGGEGG